MNQLQSPRAQHSFDIKHLYIVFTRKLTKIHFDYMFYVVSHGHHIRSYVHKLIIFGVIIFFAICRNDEYKKTNKIKLI
jgi:hypothetical protein